MYHSAKNNNHLKKVRKVIKDSGYSTGGQNHTMKRLAKEEALAAVHKHEKTEHPGKPLTKLKSGGVASGEKAIPRLDKKARGGKTKGSHVHVNVIVPQGAKQPVPVPMGAGAPPAGGAPMPPKPPMPPAGPMGGAPGGAPGMPMRQPGMKKGGKVDGFKSATKENAPSHLTAGAINGIGTMEKQKMYGDHFPKKKNGGSTKIKPKSLVDGKEISSKDGRVNVD